MDEQVKRFNEASRGIVKTNADRAEEATRKERYDHKLYDMPYKPFLT
jgi:hypothetical protein